MRLLLLSLSLLFCGALSAQDEILLLSGESIMGKVLEVGEEIRYRKADFLDGPVYVIQRAEIATITYANGHEEVFNGEASARDHSSDEILRQKQRPPVEAVTPDNSWTVRENYLRIRHFNRFYQGFRLISKTEFEDRLRSIPGAYEDFRSGRNLQVAGFVTSSAGMMVSVISILANAGGSSSSINSRLPGDSSRNRDGYGGFIVGIGTMLGGIIMVGSGNQKVLRALDTYNIEVGKNVGLRPSINANGVGLALQF